MVIKVFIDYFSQPSRAVLALCKLGQIPHEVVEIRLNRLENRSEEYAKINPMRKVPAILDTENNMALAESHSIMRYLALKYPQHLQQWYPTEDLAKRAKIDEYLDFHHLNTRRCANLIFNSIFSKKLNAVDPLFNEQRARKDVKTALKLFSKFYLGDKPFIGGDKPCIGDLSAYYQIQFLMLLGEDFSEWDLISKWLKRMGEVPEVREANVPFMKLLKKMNPNAKL